MTEQKKPAAKADAGEDRVEQEVAKAAQQKAVTRVGVPVYALVPRDINECWQMAQYFSASGVIPKSFPGQPGTRMSEAAVFGAIQHGASVGLTPPQALAHIMVVNGRFSLYGDGQLAVVRAAKIAEEFPLLEFFEESFQGKEPETIKEEWPDSFKAVCVTRRRGQARKVTKTYSVLDAKRAGLWGKLTKVGGPTPWVLSPKRMLMFRARAFNLRDSFGDCLGGFQNTAEEMVDMGDLIEIEPGVYGTEKGHPAPVPDTKPEPPASEEAEPENDPAPYYIVVDMLGEVATRADGSEAEFTRPEFHDKLADMSDKCRTGAQLDTLWENNEMHLDRLKIEDADLYDSIREIFGLRSGAITAKGQKEAPKKEPETSEKQDDPSQEPTATEDDIPAEDSGEDEDTDYDPPQSEGNETVDPPKDKASLLVGPFDDNISPMEWVERFVAPLSSFTTPAEVAEHVNQNTPEGLNKLRFKSQPHYKEANRAWDARMDELKQAAKKK